MGTHLNNCIFLFNEKLDAVPVGIVVDELSVIAWAMAEQKK